MNISKSLKDQHVPVQNFPGAKIRSIKHYIQPTLEENQPDKILLHVEMNDLSPAKNANQIASEVMKLVDIRKRLNINIIVTGIVSHGDGLNVNGKAVSKYLKKMWKSNNVWFFEHTNIIPGTHLNRGKLHLNQKGTTLLVGNFIYVFKSV